MAKEYIIPHNYKNNGRIFNILEKKNVTKSLIFVVPVTILIFNLPLTIMIKFLCETIFAIPPVLFFLMGFDEALMDYLVFSKSRRVYYDIERDDNNEYWYQKEISSCSQGNAG